VSMSKPPWVLKSGVAAVAQLDGPEAAPPQPSNVVAAAATVSRDERRRSN